MRLSVVAVGRIKAGYARDGCAQFVERLQRYFPTEIIEVRDVSRRGISVDQARAREAAALRAASPPGALQVALDERGREWDSRGFAEWLGARRDEGAGHIAFWIGGPDGLEPALRESASVVWRLGRLTLSHELARVVLTEQLYRAASLLHGLPYHRD